jgi:twinkle protein
LQNSWEKIKQCIRFWVIQNECKIIFLDNITALVSHLSPSEINSEVSKISSELAGMCQEMDFTCFVFSHLNPATSGVPHEEGGAVKEVQFTGSRALMRWSQVILGFERNKQAEGAGKNLSLIRLLKDRKFGRSGMIYTKYINETGRLLQRDDCEVSPDDPFSVYDSSNGEEDGTLTDGDKPMF